MRPNATSDYLSVYGLCCNYVTSAAHTEDIRFSATGGKTVSMKNARILVIRLDTLNPFSDSGHITYCNNFNSQSLNTAYIQGWIINTITAFHVAYYDNNGSKVLSDGGSSDANGVVNSQILFTNYPTSAPGTWHAVIYDDSVTPPRQRHTPQMTPTVSERALSLLPRKLSLSFPQ